MPSAGTDSMVSSGISACRARRVTASERRVVDECNGLCRVFVDSRLGPSSGRVTCNHAGTALDKTM